MERDFGATRKARKTGRCEKREKPSKNDETSKG
jgi:hypothetical protein